MSIAYEKSTECAACGISFTHHGHGRFRDFCSEECRKMGRAFCKGCNEPLSQEGLHRKRDFHKALCRERYYRVGPVSSSYLEERNRSVCKCGCGMPITQPKHGIRMFYDKRHSERYHRTGNRQSTLEKWGQFGPETRRAIRNVEDMLGVQAAQQVATAIDREYVLRRTQREIKSNRKLTDKQAEEIRALYTTGLYSTYDLAKKYGIGPSAIWRIVTYEHYNPERGLRHKDLGKDYSSQYEISRRRAKLTQEKADEIRRLHETEHLTHRELGERYGVTHTHIGYIVRGKCWKPEHDPRQKEVKTPAKNK